MKNLGVFTLLLLFSSCRAALEDKLADGEGKEKSDEKVEDWRDVHP